MSPQRVSELITSDRNPASMFLLPFNDAFVLVKGWDYTSEECTTQPLPPSLAHTFTHSFCPYLFPRRPGLFNYRFSAQSLHTGCMSNSMLAQSQTADGARKSLHIILNLFHWPTVQNIHLHWASLKSALTASKHWTPSRATTVSIFKQYPPQSIQLRTFPHSHTRAHGRYTIILQTDSIWQQASKPLLVLQSATVICQQIHIQFSLMMWY